MIINRINDIEYFSEISIGTVFEYLNEYGRQVIIQWYKNRGRTNYILYDGKPITKEQYVDTLDWLNVPREWWL